MGWFDTKKSPKLKAVEKRKSATATPNDLWKKCHECGEIMQAQKLTNNFQVCPYCQHHYRLSAQDRVALLFDDNTFQPLHAEIVSRDPLAFTDKMSYRDRLDKAFAKTKMKDGALLGSGKINGQKVVAAIMEFSFMGGSMGVATGEKIARAFDLGVEQGLPVLVVSSSGGARMQEGILSLMQMAKTAGARQKLQEKGLPYISLLADPTTGGCAASFSMLGDLNLAEPKALIGFAGPRVIEQSIRQKLPEGFQTSEFLLEHGFVDRVIHRHLLKKEISFFFKMFTAA